MTMTDSVYWDVRRRAWMIQIELSSEDAREIAYALGVQDSGAQHLLVLADEADEKRRSDA